MNFTRLFAVGALCLKISAPALAQTEALEVCRSLAENRLTDRYAENSSNFVAQREFDLFCSESGSYSSSFSQKSSAFRASFAEIGRKFGLGSNNVGGSGLTESEFETVCSIGSGDFVSNYSRAVRQELGGTLAAIVSECVKNVMTSGEDWVHGVAELTADGKFFLAQIDRKAPNTAPDLELVAVDPAQYFYSCKVGTNRALGSRLVNNIALSCELSQAAPTEGIQGFLHFQNSGDGQARTVRFDVRRNDFIRRSEVEDTARIVAEEAILENSREVVFAFDREDCPLGYSPYENSAGRFLRGIDHNSSGVDPDGARSAGTVQDDAIQNHTHRIAPEAGALVIWHDKNQRVASHGFAIGAERAAVKATEPVDGARVSSETRPKNIAVSFCVRRS